MSASLTARFLAVSRPRLLATGIVASISGGSLAAALAFEHLGGYAPCILCLYQRVPHLVALTLGVIGVVLAIRHEQCPVTRPLLAIASLVFLTGAGIAFFHVGVEQGWWPGTAGCGGGDLFAQDLSPAELHARLMAAPVVRCDEVPWSLLGVSMAGYNFGLCVVAAAACLWMRWALGRPVPMDRKTS